MSGVQGIVVSMTKRIIVATMTMLAAFAAGISLATPAQAAVNAESRIVAIDLPDALNGTPVVIVYLTSTDGTVMALTTKTENGSTSILVDQPSELASVTVKVGKKRLRADHFTVTDLAPTPEAYGMTVGCLTTNSNGEQVVIRGDGTLYIPATGKVTPVISVANLALKLATDLEFLIHTSLKAIAD